MQAHTDAQFDAAPGDTVSGFTVVAQEEIPELGGVAYTMQHTASGARLLLVANDDVDKAFSIGFKTPPSDSTGVFHILEHSVLNGSARFPVKEPFVNLLKSSMQTFLNAFTFPDKTMYPVASTNEQDLLNLMDVYMDAVTHPLIYVKDAIFRQEGWHYEVEGDGSITVNGVVFNEMKGALSDPDDVLVDALNASLFPDTCYRFESGGDPAVIPELTYEEYLRTHARHYSLSNSYIVLYGNMDARRVLAFLDERYLSDAAREEALLPADLPIDRAAAAQEGPNPLDVQKPVHAQDATVTMGILEDNAVAGLAFVAGSVLDHSRMLALDVLVDALMGSNEAPLKKALLAAGFGDDVRVYVTDDMRQPVVYFVLKGAKKGQLDTFEACVRNVCQELVNSGVPHDALYASEAQMAFRLREANYDMSDGVICAVNVMRGWLYDDAHATDYIKYEDDLTFARAGIENGLYEQLLREVILENAHWARAEVLPGKPADQYVVPNDVDRDQVVKDMEELRTMQEVPDTLEALATLPHLEITDIGEAPADPDYSIRTDTPLPTIEHVLDTRGINYVYGYFDLSGLSFEELPIAQIAAGLLGSLDTAHHTAAELNIAVKLSLGRMFFTTEVGCRDDAARTPLVRMVTGACSIVENQNELASLLQEVMRTSNFADKERVHNLLVQRRVGLEQGFANSGHLASLSRVNSYYSKAGMVREKLAGVDFYQYLADLLDHFDERFDAFAAELTQVCERMFASNRATISFVGATGDADAFWSKAQTLGLVEDDGVDRLVIPEPVVKNEACIVPTDIVYCAAGCSMDQADTTFDGSWLVAAKALSYGYLWNQVRVKNGAYGVGFKPAWSGDLRFYSYRDPHLALTYEAYADAASWLAGLDVDAREVTDWIVSTVAGLDAPEKPARIVRRQDTDWLANRPRDNRDVTRAQVLASTLERIRAHARALSSVVGEGSAKCVFGSKELIQQEGAGFTVVDLVQ